MINIFIACICSYYFMKLSISLVLLPFSGYLTRKILSIKNRIFSCPSVKTYVLGTSWDNSFEYPHVLVEKYENELLITHSYLIA